jgi:hypothetical protein
MRAPGIVVAIFGFMAIGTGSGCFSPDLGNGQIACGDGNLCPRDYVCVDKHCRKSGGDFGVAGGGGGGGGNDPVDMAVPISDMVVLNGGCNPGVTRVCLDSTHSATCVTGSAGSMPVLDRPCPPGSLCSAGHCLQPTGADACNNPTLCTNGKVCVAYVVNNGSMLRLFCTDPVSGATGGIRAPCTTPGYDSTCQTGICAQAMDGKHVCAVLCRTVADCGGTDAGACQTILSPAAVEGFSTSAGHVCTP